MFTNKKNGKEKIQASCQKRPTTASADGLRLPKVLAPIVRRGKTEANPRNSRAHLPCLQNQSVEYKNQPVDERGPSFLRMEGQARSAVCHIGVHRK